MEKANVNPNETEDNDHCNAPDFSAQISAAAALLRQSDVPSIFEDQFDAFNSPLLRLWHEYVHPKSGAASSTVPHQAAEQTIVNHPHDPTFARSIEVVKVPEDLTPVETTAKTTVPNDTVSVSSTAEVLVGHGMPPHENLITQTDPQSPLHNVIDTSQSMPGRHTYTPGKLYRLRHSRRLEFPLGSLIAVSEEKNNSLPALPFTPCETLTADVLLAGDDARAKFSDLQLSPALLSALPSVGFETPSPIQIRTIPRARLGCDVIAHAKSGTGKTAAYAVAALDTQMAGSSFGPNSGRPHTLVLVPTRELAIQTARVFASVAAHVVPPVSVATLVGGVSEQYDLSKLAACSPHIVVGTPGRVCSLVDSSNLTLHAVSVIVLDEADRLLSRAFQNDVHSIINSLPQAHQTLAFSATFPPWLRRMLMGIMRSPAYITDSDDRNPNNDLSEGVAAVQQAILLGVRQCKVAVQSCTLTKDQHTQQRAIRKVDILIRLLQEETFQFCMVFSNQKKLLGMLEAKLRKSGFSCKKMSGDVSQRERNSVMAAVDNRTIRVVVTTDLLARGIDIKTCDIVVHLDVPSEVETYLHRVGRAGRFGRQGRSFLLFDADKERAGVFVLESALGHSLEHTVVSNSEAIKHRKNSGEGDDQTKGAEEKRRSVAIANMDTTTAARDGGMCTGATPDGMTDHKGVDTFNLPTMRLIDPVMYNMSLMNKMPLNQSPGASPSGEPRRPDDPSCVVNSAPASDKLDPQCDVNNSRRQNHLEKKDLEGSVMNHSPGDVKHSTKTVGSNRKRDEIEPVESVRRNKKIKLGSTALDRDNVSTEHRSYVEVVYEEAIKKNWVYLAGGRSIESNERWEKFAQEAWRNGYVDTFKRAFQMATELSQRLRN